MADIMALSLPIEIPGATEAVAVLKRIETAGMSTAMTYNANWTQATAQVTTAYKQVEKAGVESQTRIGNASQASTKKYAQAALQIAGTLQAITAAGDVSAGQVTRLISLAAGVAFNFGPQGQVIGAIGLATVSIVNMFTRAREESEKLKKKLSDDIREIRATLDLGSAEGKMRQARFAQFDAADVLGKMREQLEAFSAMEPRPDAAILDLTDAIAKQEAVVADAERQTRRWFSIVQDIRTQQKLLKSDEEAATQAIRDQETAAKRLAEALRDTWNEMVKFANKPLSAQQVGAGVKGLPAPTMFGPGNRAPIIAFTDEQAQKIEDETVRRMQSLQDRIEAQAMELAQSIGSAIGGAFRTAAASGSIGEGIKALADAVLSTFGGMLQQIGVQALAAMEIIKNIAESIAKWNPVAGIAASLALIALGGALQGAGSRSHGGGGSGGGRITATRDFAGSTTTVAIGGTSSASTPIAQPPQPVVFAPTIIGTDDAGAQRQLKTMLDNAVKRGL